MRDVAVIGIGMTSFGELWETPLRSLWAEAALASLTEDQQQAVVLRIEMGLSFQQVAEATESPSADAARMLVTRALARLSEKGASDKRKVDQQLNLDDLHYKLRIDTTDNSGTTSDVEADGNGAL